MSPSSSSVARRTLHPLALRLLAAGIVLIGLGPAPASARQDAPWVGQEDQIERFLRDAVVVDKERLGSGVTRPFRVVLEQGGLRRRAIWKPIQRRSSADGLESYRAEIAAYRLSRHLGLDMVPPTVERRIGNRYGSLQMWIEGYGPFAETEAAHPPSLGDWSRQMARAAFFDALIDNPDRHHQNFLVDDSWQVVLIDHSRTLNFDRRGPQRASAPPTRFESALVERARALDLVTLRSLLSDLLRGSELRALLHRRDELLDRVAEITAQRGEQVAFYAD
ncbi:MAG TPA: hypothetical protein VMV46_05700 [Thermoanaerobaculia bacterium]|nr:hypothetical protein [Thermoanaerobaculia bacterium]